MRIPRTFALSMAHGTPNMMLPTLNVRCLLGCFFTMMHSNSPSTTRAVVKYILRYALQTQACPRGWVMAYNGVCVGAMADERPQSPLGRVTTVLLPYLTGVGEVFHDTRKFWSCGVASGQGRAETRSQRAAVGSLEADPCSLKPATDQQLSDSQHGMWSL